MPNRDEIKTYSGSKVRQGEIILRTRWRRIVFIVGLAGIVIIGLIIRFAG